ncbi:MAG: hypothetical protein IKM04_07340 [Clostridia bacterium]|nr:hypothetical protein [Clostridia bacterium]
MSKLLKATFFRYTHSMVFGICLLLTAVFAGLFSRWIHYASELSARWFLAEIIVFATVICLTVGTETAGCVKNKLVCGFSRTKIFFSELIVANVVVLFFFAIFAAFSFVVNIRLLGNTPLKMILQCLLGFGCMAVMLATAFVTVSCIFSRPAAAAAGCMITVVVLFASTALVLDLLAEPEFFKGRYRVDGGEWQDYIEENERYVDSPLREVLIFYKNANPFGVLSDYEDVMVPWLYEDEALASAMDATANTIGNDFLRREISPDEQRFLDRAPIRMVAPVPVLILAGWLIFRRKTFS